MRTVSLPLTTPDLDSRREGNKYIRVVSSLKYAALSRSNIQYSDTQLSSYRVQTLSFSIMSNFEKSAHIPRNSMTGDLPTSQNKGGAHHSQPALTCLHVKEYGSMSSATPASCPHCLPPPSNTMSDFTSSELKGRHSENLHPSHQGCASSHEDLSQTERPAQKSSHADSSQYSQGLQLDSTNKATSSVPIEQSLPTYRPLDAWINTPTNEDPWTVLRTFNDLRVEDNGNEEMRNGYMDSESEGQRNGSA